MMRIDKFLWCIRIYKTRSLATEACNGRKVKLNGKNVKPAKEVFINDEISFKRGVVQYTYSITQFPKNRLPAKEVFQYIVDITPDTEIIKLEDSKLVKVPIRDKGSGRPTKKERRDIDKLKG